MFRTRDGEGAHALDMNQIIDQLNGRGVIAGGNVTAAPGSHMVQIESTAVYLNEQRHDISQTTIDLATYIENAPRKGLIYINTDGEIAFAGGEPEEPRPKGEYRFQTYRPAPPDLSHMDCVVLAEVWLSPLDTQTTDADIKNRNVSADFRIHAASVDVLEADTLVDGSGTAHSGELADQEDIPTDANIRQVIYDDPDHATLAPHNYFSGSHDDLTDIRVDQHHAPPTEEEMRDAVRGIVDAAELDGASGATGQHLEWTGSDVQWLDPPAQQATVYDSGTITHTGGSQTTVLIENVAPEETSEFSIVIGVDTPPTWDANYGYSVTNVSRQWDDTNAQLNAEVTLEWDTDPGSGNDLTLGYTVWDREPAIVQGRFTNADAIQALDGASISPAEVIISSRFKYPVYDELSNVPPAEVGDFVVVSGNGSDPFGGFIYNGVEWSGPLGASVSNLSDLIINTGKDWNGYPITNVGAPQDPADAARQQELTDHANDASAHHAPVTGSDIDHANLQNVQPDQHHPEPTEQEIIERTAGHVFSLPLFGATIPDGEYLRNYVSLGSDETLTMVRGELFAEGGEEPPDLELQLFDKGSSTVVYQQPSDGLSLVIGDSLATISGPTKVEARLYNGTGSDISASGIVSYHL